MTGYAVQRRELRIPAGTGEQLDAWAYLPERPAPLPADRRAGR